MLLDVLAGLRPKLDVLDGRFILGLRLLVALDGRLLAGLWVFLDATLGAGFTVPELVQVALAEVEIEHIRNVLGSVGGNKSRAAEVLGIDRKTLREKLRHC